jgi:hypothetical protein
MIGARPNGRQDLSLTEAPVGRFEDHQASLANMICQHLDTINAMIAYRDERLRPPEAKLDTITIRSLGEVNE